MHHILCPQASIHPLPFTRCSCRLIKSALADVGEAYAVQEWA